MDRSCFRKGQQLKEKEGKEGQGTPGGVQWRKRKNNWNGTFEEGCMLL